MTVVVKSGESVRRKDGIGGKDVVRHVGGMMLLYIGRKDSTATYRNSIQGVPNTQSEDIPKAHDVEGKALLVEPNHLIYLEPGAPESEHY